MIAPVTKFSFTATLVCVAMLWHGSLQMPTQARMKTDSLCDSPNVERDLLLGLRVMYRGGIFNNARSVSSKYIILYNHNTVQWALESTVNVLHNNRVDVIVPRSISLQVVNSQNLSIEINSASIFQNVSDNLCSIMMYSDFLEVSSSKNSTALQMLQRILQENIRDGCSLLKNQSAFSDQVNFTSTAQLSEGNSQTDNTAECNDEDLEILRAHCLEQSLIQRFLRQPYSNLFGAITSDCLNTKRKCGWIDRRFQEPERSIVVEHTTLSCTASK